MRNAFSMITAIFVIVLMATVAAFVMSLSGKTTHATTAQFQREQAMLYAKSYTEYAVLAVTAHDRATNNNCVETITGTIGTYGNGGYNIRTHIAYIGANTEISMCNTILNTTNVITPSTPLSIIVDVYVDYKEFDNPSAPKITVHRRTIQKI